MITFRYTRQTSMVAFVIGYIACSTLIIQIATSWPLEKTSQYLGTQNQNGEQLLLFKLPKSISSQIQGQIQPQQQQNQAISSQFWLDDQVQPEASLLSGQQMTPIYGEQQQQQQRPDERSISLTIPVSELGSATRLQSQLPQLQYKPLYTERSKYATPSAGSIHLPHYPGSPVIFDYLATDESNSHEVKDGRQSEPHVVAVTPVSVRQGEKLHLIPSQQQEHTLQVNHNRASNLSSAIEQTVRQYLQQQAAEYSPTTMITPTTTLTSETTTNPELYYQVNPTTQLVGQQQVEQQQQQQQPDQQSSMEQSEQARHVQQSHSSEGPGLLSRLANSSPDLLLRLRSLLRQAAREGRNSTESLFSKDNNSSNSVGTSLYSKNEPESGLGGFPTENKQYTQQGSLRGPFNGSNSMLNTFLTSHNLSSHEEIKIPLVVIAMPRILSLKRNQLATSQPRSSNSSSSSSIAFTAPPAIIKQAIISPAMIVNSTQADVVNNGTQLVRLAFKGLNETISEGSNYTGSNLSTSSTQNVIPYAYLARDLREPSLSSVPRHTMAPYARQFAVTAITPTAHQFAHNPRVDQSYRYEYPQSSQVRQQHPQLVNQTEEYYVQNSNESQFKQQQQNQHQQQLHYQRGHITQPELGTMIIDRNNSSGQLMILPAGAQSQNNSPESSNVQLVRVLEQPAAIVQPQEQQLERFNFVQPMQRKPNEVAFEYILNREQPQLRQPLRQDNIQIVEQQVYPSRSPYKILNPVNDQARSSQMMLAENQVYPQIAPNQILSKLNMSSSSVISEEQRSPTTMMRSQFAPDSTHGILGPLNHFARANSRSLFSEGNLSRLRPLFNVARQRMNPQATDNELEEQLMSNKLLDRQLLGILDQPRADRRSLVTTRWNAENEHQLLQQNPNQLARIEHKKAPKMVVMIV